MFCNVEMGACCQQLHQLCLMDHFLLFNLNLLSGNEGLKPKRGITGKGQTCYPGVGQTYVGNK